MKFKLFLFIQCLSLAISYCLAAVSINDVEKKIIASIDNEEANARILLKRVVNINSGTMNFPGVRKVGDIFSIELEKLGFASQWINGKTFNRAGHLLASNISPNPQAPKLLLIGHLDTVFAADSPFQHYEKIAPNKVKGPGVIDMKGGDVVIVHALKALFQAGVLNQFSIKVIMTGDEEKRGEPLDIATKALIDAAKWADIAIGFEDGDGDPTTAVISRRGAISWQLNITGKPAHSSQIFRNDIGYGAIYEAARILDGFRQALAHEPNLTFNPGLIVGGTNVEYDSTLARATAFGKDNVIAQAVTVSGDIRTLSQSQLQMAKKKMQLIVSKHLPLTDAKLEFRNGYPPMAPSKGNANLLAMYNKASLDLGFGPVKAVDPRRAGAADISFTAGHVEMAIDGIGLMGDDGHTIHETADMTTLNQQTKRAAILIYRLLKKN